MVSKLLPLPLQLVPPPSLLLCPLLLLVFLLLPLLMRPLQWLMVCTGSASSCPPSHVLLLLYPTFSADMAATTSSTDGLAVWVTGGRRFDCCACMVAGKRLEPTSPARPGLQIRKGRSGRRCGALCSDLQSPKAAARVQQHSGSPSACRTPERLRPGPFAVYSVGANAALVALR